MNVNDCFADLSSFPYKIGFDLAGVVAEVGSGVTKFKVGDEVYSRLEGKYKGSLAEYALASTITTELKPKSQSFSQAAALPLAGEFIQHSSRVPRNLPALLYSSHFSELDCEGSLFHVASSDEI